MKSDSSIQKKQGWSFKEEPLFIRFLIVIDVICIPLLVYFALMASTNVYLVIAQHDQTLYARNDVKTIWSYGIPIRGHEISTDASVYSVGTIIYKDKGTTKAQVLTLEGDTATFEVTPDNIEVIKNYTIRMCDSVKSVAQTQVTPDFKSFKARWMKYFSYADNRYALAYIIGKNRRERILNALHN